MGYQASEYFIAGLVVCMLIGLLRHVLKLIDGADAAHADDACHLKLTVVTWLTDANPQLICSCYRPILIFPDFSLFFLIF